MSITTGLRTCSAVMPGSLATVIMYTLSSGCTRITSSFCFSMPIMTLVAVGL